jgi:hypothetical protein
MIRNFGTVIDDDAVRSLVLSTRLLGTREIMIINHTDCGMLRFADSEFEDRLRKETGRAAIAPARFYSLRVWADRDSGAPSNGRLSGLTGTPQLVPHCCHQKLVLPLNSHGTTNSPAGSSSPGPYVRHRVSSTLSSAQTLSKRVRWAVAS